MQRQEEEVMAITLRGPSAELRVGYETAACLGRWELTPTESGFTLSASVIHRNLYWLTAGYPIDICLTVGHAAWRWRDVQISGDDPLVVVGTGKPEVS